MNRQKNNQLHQDQNGFASLVVAMMMILVLSLITVGFAQLARREQQNALNKQLSSQSYYAAEAGINDAFNLVKQHGGLYDQEVASTTSRTVPANTCINTYNGGSLWQDPITHVSPSNKIDVPTDTAYTCVMIDLSPTSLTYSGVSPGAYRNVVFAPIDLASGGASDVKTLDVHWGSADGHVGFPAGGFMPTGTGAGKWGDALGVIQLSVTPLTNNFNRQYLIDNTFTVYLYPQNGAADTIDYDVTADDNAPVKNAGCDNSGDDYSQCTASIGNIPPASSYLVHFTAYYDTTNVKLNAKNSSGILVGTQGGQVVVDSTGKARDVLKRLQVHVPLTVDGSKPNEALEGQSICKRFTTYPGAIASPETPAGYSGTGNACDFWAQP